MLTPLNFVPGDAAAACDAEAAGALGGADVGPVDAGADDADGLAVGLQAVNTRMGTIAAAIDRNRDTTLALLLTHVPSSNILNTRR